MDSDVSSVNGTVKALKVEHAWTINNFSTHQMKPGNGIVSPTFFVGGSGDLQGRLVLYPNGHSEEDKDFISLFLHLDSRQYNAVRVRLRCYLLNDKHEEVTSCRIVHSFIKGQGFGFPTFMRRSLLVDKSNSLIPNDRLTIVCGLNILGRSEDTTAAAGEKFIKAFTSAMTTSCDVHEKSFKRCETKTDDSKLLENEFSDVTLSSHGIEFRAHRNILAARSLVFSAMFMRRTKDSDSSVVELNDIQPEVLREVLRYIYTGRVDNWTLVPGLLDACNQFGLDGLKSMCERVLFNSMNLNNVFEILMLADKHNVKCLKKQALEIIILYAQAAIKTPGFESLKESKRTDLMAEAFCALAMAQRA